MTFNPHSKPTWAQHAGNALVATLWGPLERIRTLADGTRFAFGPHISDPQRRGYNYTIVWLNKDEDPAALANNILGGREGRPHVQLQLLANNTAFLTYDGQWPVLKSGLPPQPAHVFKLESREAFIKLDHELKRAVGLLLSAKLGDKAEAIYSQAKKEFEEKYADLLQTMRGQFRRSRDGSIDIKIPANDSGGDTAEASTPIRLRPRKPM